jgi:hypothetical protein
MRNALDRPVAAEDVARVTARDEVVTAERAVDGCRLQLAERERALVALDHPLTHAWMTLTGGKDAAVEDAAAQVAEAQRRLAFATASLERARQRAAGIDADAAARAEEARRDAEAHEAAFAALLASDHPVADELRALRLERELLVERFGAVEEAALAGSDLLAALATVSRQTEAIRASTSTVGVDTWRANADGRLDDLLFGELLGTGAHGLVAAAVADTPGRVDRFRAALSGLGQRFDDAVAEDAWALEAEIRERMAAIDRELRELRTSIPALEAEERRIVAGASGR